MTATLTPLAAHMLASLKALESKHEPREHGGFYLDDMLWHMGKPFIAGSAIIAELQSAGAVRWIAGDTNEDGEFQAEYESA